VGIKYHLQKRLFLNRDKDKPAFILACVEDTREIPDSSDQITGEITLSISDCYDRISLHFYLGNADDRANSLYKIRRLAETINKFQQALEIEAKIISKRKIPKKKEENTG
jgi:hypothetical protein